MSTLAAPRAVFSSAVPRGHRSVRWSRTGLIGLVTALAAGLANIVVYYLCKPAVGFDPAFVELQSAIGIGIFTVMLAIPAVLVYAALLKFAADPVNVFSIVSSVVLAISIVPDLTFIPTEPGASAAQTAVLVLMHFVAAAVIVGLLSALAPAEER